VLRGDSQRGSLGHVKKKKNKKRVRRARGIVRPRRGTSKSARRRKERSQLLIDSHRQGGAVRGRSADSGLGEKREKKKGKNPA